jgi:quinol monooxygenase YgiN
MSVHFFVQLEPASGRATEFRNELLKVVGPSRAEAGCLALNVFESLREPLRFAIHSEWADEAAFEWHAQLPHTVRFVKAAEELLTHEIQGLRARQIGEGAGASVRG